MGQVRQVDRRLFRDDAGFLARGLARMTAHNIDTPDNCPVLFWQHGENLTLFALIATGQYNDAIALFELQRRHNSEHLRRKRYDLHVVLASELARHRPENAGADRLAGLVDQDRCVAVEADQ